MKQLIKGKKYWVDFDHKFHAGRVGVFEFLCGQDVAVLSDAENQHNLFAVSPDDLHEPARDEL